MSGMIPWGKRQFCDGNGNPLVGGWVAYCQVGTGGAVFRNIYGDAAETLVLENPVPLDASGRPFSGGSQQSLWGDGTYEEYVYDHSGVLQTSSIVGTPLDDLSGNLTVDGSLTVNGATTLNGPLTVNGNETDNGNLSAQNGNFGGLGVSGNASIGGNENVGGALTAGDIYSNSDVNAADNLNANNINANSGTITNLNVPGTLNANVINANQINAPGQGGLPGIQTGYGTISTQTIGGMTGGFAVINFTNVTNLLAVLITQVSTEVGPEGDLSPALIIRNVSNSQFTVHMIGYNPSTPVPVSFYWVVFG